MQWRNAHLFGCVLFGVACVLTLSISIFQAGKCPIKFVEAGPEMTSSHNVKVKSKSSNYSSFTCFGNHKRANSLVGRGCLWHNVCYNGTSSRFLYYQKRKQALLFDQFTGPLFAFPPKFVALTQFDYGWNPNNSFTPDIVYDTPPSEGGLHITHLAALWMPWSTIDANLGHLLWEEISPLFWTPLRFGIPVENLKEMHIFSMLDPLPSYALFHKVLSFFLPLITSVPLQPFPYSRTLVCFDSLLTGGVNLFFRPTWDPDLVSHAFGRESLLLQWREHILRQLRLDPWKEVDILDPETYIVLVNKSSSFLGAARRSISNLHQVVDFLERYHISSRVKVIEWQHSSLQEQMEILMNTSLLITPAGGISMLIPFLPIHAHVLIMDFPSNRAQFGIPANASGSMEASFWTAWTHLYFMYYQVFPWQTDSFVLDVPGTTDYRNHASIRIQPEQLFMILDPLFF